MTSLLAAGLLLTGGLQLAQAQDTRSADSPDSSMTGPIRLRQPEPDTRVQRNDDAVDSPNRTTRRNRAEDEPEPAAEKRYQPSEFEAFVRRVAASQGGANGAELDSDGNANGNGSTNGNGNEPGSTLRRLGADLMVGDTSRNNFLPVIPADYVISVGDELQVGISGSVDADLRLTVDRSGRINIPRVGSVLVAGVHYSDLQSVLSQRVGQVFRNFQLSASLGQLRGIRVYVTGFTAHPGSYTVSSLSTIVNALLKSGGPSPAGSFRDIKLMRGGKLVSTFDLYDLLLRGDKSADRVLQAEDVVQIGPVGPQVGMIGSVNHPAIFELKPDDTVADVLRMAGEFSSVADTTRLAIERLGQRNDVRVVQLEMPAAGGTKPRAGDILHAFSLVAAAQPLARQNKRVRVEGEVFNPGDVVLPAGSTIADALRAAGGLTPAAFVYGTDFRRESVRVTQQENYDRALRDLQAELNSAAATKHASTADEATAQQTQSGASDRLIASLRAVRPTGRIVLQLDPGATALPNLPMEEGDRLYVPAKPSVVGVYGSVFTGGSFLYSNDHSIDEYLGLAGGPKKSADTGSIFVVHANGSITSVMQNHHGWFSQGATFLKDLPAIAGDTVFVPEELDKTTFLQKAKDWTQILYQFGIGAAAIAVLKQ